MYFLTGIFLICFSVAEAQEETERKWNFNLAPLVYFPVVKGDVVLNNNAAELDVKTQLSGILTFEAYTKKWSVISDYMILNMSTDVTLPISDRTALYRLTTNIVGFYGTYKLTKWFELGLGGRIGFMNNRLNADAATLLPEIDAQYKSTLFIPLLVYRFNFLHTDKWKIRLRGDYGGFGFFDFRSYLVNPYVGWHFTEIAEAYVGYRVISMTREDKEGNDSFDLLFYGPQFGFIFHL